MRTVLHTVDLRYTRAELHAFLAAQRREDVELGGRYDGGTAAINVWSHSWVTPRVTAGFVPYGDVLSRLGR
jgi:hypothetical protein